MILVLLVALLGCSLLAPHTAAPAPANSTSSSMPRIELRLTARIPAIPNITVRQPFPLIPALNKSLTVTGLPTLGAWINASATLKLPASWVEAVRDNVWLNARIILGNDIKQPQLIINATRP